MLRLSMLLGCIFVTTRGSAMKHDDQHASEQDLNGDDSAYSVTCYMCVNVSDNLICNQYAIDRPCTAGKIFTYSHWATFLYLYTSNSVIILLFSIACDDQENKLPLLLIENLLVNLESAFLFLYPHFLVHQPENLKYQVSFRHWLPTDAKVLELLMWYYFGNPVCLP